MRLPAPLPTARLVGTGRAVLGGAFLAAPVAAVTALGVDVATAKRVVFLSRMMAGRDLVIGLGTLTSRRPAGWLLAGAAADAVDAVALARARRERRAGGPVAAALVPGAAALAGLGAGAALAALRRR
ncbi:MAG: hypothetical protein EPN43_03790 [Jatrophihabitans sp.]|nr:MAG: hypothetical protein EPN43_03790 [Jatrophihabitans sp.]